MRLNQECMGGVGGKEGVNAIIVFYFQKCILIVITSILFNVTPQKGLLVKKIALRTEAIVWGIHAERPASHFYSVTLSYMTHINHLVSLSLHLLT